MSAPHAVAAYERLCEYGHRYTSVAVGARWTTAKGNARYFCPSCYALGKRPPKDWRRSR